VAAYINKILRVFGIVEGTKQQSLGLFIFTSSFSLIAEADITFAADSESSSASVDRESIIRPYVSAIAKFRTDIRQLAREKVKTTEHKR